MIGKELSDIFSKVANTLWRFEVDLGMKPGYTEEGFKGGIKIFMSVLMDKIFELQEDEDLSIEDRMNMATKAGEDIRKLVKTYTGLDTKNFYNERGKVKETDI